MFRFESPIYLYLLLLLPVTVLLHYAWNYIRRSRLRKYGDKELVRLLMTDVSRLRQEIKFWLFLAATACMILAMARPQFGSSVQTHERKGIEAVIALDISNSMLARDVTPSRLEKSKMLISNIVDNMKDDKVGLIVFAGQAFTQLPITNDYVSAKMFLETISPSMISVQGTDIATAIDLAQKSFTSSNGASRAIFIITDGEDNEGQAVEAARNAAKAGIRIYMLGIGSPDGAPVPIAGTHDYMTDENGETVISRLNEDMCRVIAQAGNGNYIYVDNSSSAQEKLDAYISNLSRTSFESQVYNEYDEQYQGLILLGLIFLIIDIFIMERENHVLQRFTFFSK